jgi:hypothetical protein
LSYSIRKSGAYKIKGAFARVNNAINNGDGVEVSIFKNADKASPLFSSSISSNHIVNPDDPFSGTGVAHFNLEVNLKPNDILRFVVSSGPRQEHTFDVTALKAAIAFHK